MTRFGRWLVARQQPSVQATVGQRLRFRMGRRFLIAGGYFLALFFFTAAILLRDDIPLMLSSSVMVAAWLIAARGFRIQLHAMDELYVRWPVDRATTDPGEYRLESKTAMGSIGRYAVAFFLTAGISFSLLSVGFVVGGGETPWVAVLAPPGSGFLLAFLMWRRQPDRDRT